MLSLVLLGCVFGDVKALKAEVASLQEEVDELEEELDAQSQVDTGEPVDSEDSGGGDSEEPFEVPTVRYWFEGTSPNYTSIIEITGDYDAKRVSVLINGGFAEPSEDCIEYDGAASVIFVEFWYNGIYDCWSLQAISQCNQIPYNVAELSCD
ncbi:hypothetical protein L6R49_31370 [Myxococcota bacterium]|nr:hypothetical protein [Myxococcota bacterium]